MQVVQNIYKEGDSLDFNSFQDSDLVLMFGNIPKFCENQKFQNLFDKNKNLNVVGCSTSGEIHNGQVHHDSLSVTSIKFNCSTVQIVSSEIKNNDIRASARDLSLNLPKDGLKTIIALSIGHSVNGTEVLNGLKEVISSDVLITGGLAGGEVDIEQTFVSHNEKISDNLIVLIGLYGDNITAKSSISGGWNRFGPERLVTKSNANILYELDGVPALDIYKEYLGDKVKDLPSSALLFPLSLKINNEFITRAILDINQEEGTMIFGGDIPENSNVQFMISNHNELINGVENSAIELYNDFEKEEGLILLVSCIGRKLILKEYTEDEVEAVSNSFSDKWKNCGFYSYGEFSTNNDECLLHNQTMVITAISESNE